MKTLTLLLIILSTTCFSQTREPFKETIYEIEFKGLYQITQADDTTKQMMVWDDVVIFTVNNYEDTLHVIIATDSTRGNIIMPYLGALEVFETWNGVDLVFEY